MATVENKAWLGKLPSNWQVRPLPEIVFFQEGPGLRKWQWTGAGMKVINVTNIIGDGSVDVTNTQRFISLEEFQAKYSHFAVEDRDVVVASSGNTYGKVGRISQSALPLMMNTSVIRFHPLDPSQLHPDFLHAFLRSPAFRSQIERLVVGAAQPNFGPFHLKQMVVPLPPSSVQSRIAAILSAYDDLIENNTKRIKNLEEMARSLYREWFVNFRFPGHKKIKFTTSKLGKIPSTWTLTTLGERVELAYGKALKEEDRQPGDVPVYGSSGAVGWHNEAHSEGPGIIVGRKGNVGSVHWCDLPFFPIDTVFFVRTSLPLHFVFFNLQGQNFLNNDAAVPGLNRNQAYSLPLLVPDDEVLAKFADFAKTVFEQVRVLSNSATNLRATRDLLLRRLISGEIDVSSLRLESAAS